MSSLEELEKLPEIDFTGGLTLEVLQQEMIKAYQKEYEEYYGEKAEIEKGNKMRLLILATATVLMQQSIRMDNIGKMNLLKYSYGDFLDNVAIGSNVVREKEKCAAVEVQFRLEKARDMDTVIPKGTRVTGGKMYFETQEEESIQAGETSIILTLVCTEKGTQGNGLKAGEIATLADPVAYVTASNISESYGGADVETDNNVKERCMLSGSQYCTTGTEPAYEYFCKKEITDIKDIKIYVESPGVVAITYIKDKGILPTQEETNRLTEYLNDKRRKVLTDTVKVVIPEKVEYEIALTYYIRKSDRQKEETIKESVMSAINAYKTWQATGLGRDITTDALQAAIWNAGAKRVVITAPAYTVLDNSKVALCIAENITYGGLEDD